jgi:hypothetical protein
MLEDYNRNLRQPIIPKLRFDMSPLTKSTPTTNGNEPSATGANLISLPTLVIINKIQHQLALLY